MNNLKLAAAVALGVILSWFGLSQALGDWDGDGRPDLVGIYKRGNQGHTEVHIVSGASDFKTFVCQEETKLGPTEKDWDYRMADWDGDGRPDLVGILRNNSRGKTELHVYSGRSGFKDAIYETETELGPPDDSWEHLLCDWDGDGRPDLVGIYKRGNQGHTEVHILSGASDFKIFICREETKLGPTEKDWDYRMADWDGDGRPDLVGICKKGAQGHTEVHILSGAKRFHEFLSQEETGLFTTDERWVFRLANWDNDNRVDLVGILLSNSRSKTEVHVLSGASGFKKFLSRIETSFGPSDKSWDFEVVNKGFLDLFGINVNIKGEFNVNVEVIINQPPGQGNPPEHKDPKPEKSPREPNNNGKRDDNGKSRDKKER